MASKPNNPPPPATAAAVELGSSDGEVCDGGAGASAGSSSRADGTSAEQQQGRRTSAATMPTALVSAEQSREGETSEWRSFWKAGNYAVGDTAKFPSSEELLEHARVHPKFLHSNATSHKWAFGAIAELLDNAVDEIHNGATFVKVDRIDVMKDNSPALLFLDDGGGMDPDCLRKCMSLGYSSKKANTTIGQYGNGFKTSTMRLGADVIVFSRARRKSQTSQSVGLLSYTYLRKTGQDDVIVPMIDFDTTSNWAEPIFYGSPDDWSSNLKTILEWSPFTSKEELMLQFDDIGDHGTKVIVYNLWLNDEGIYELSFDDDDEDIRLRDEVNEASSARLNKKIVELQSHISYRLRYSLRAYASMLYLKKFQNFKIILRGKPVEQYNIADELQYSTIVSYKPQVATMKEMTVETKIGFIKEAPSLNVCGFNVYHKNRLIRPFWKVTADGSSKGNYVVGVLEANFIEPAHDKQDFERSSLFIRLESRLKQMVNDYWKEYCHFMGYQPPAVSSQKAQLAAKNRKLLQASQHVTGLSANTPGALSESGFPENGQRSDLHRNLSAGSYEVVNLEDSEDETEPLSVDQICEENIQLFMRCDEHLRKQTELKQTIINLEAQLDNAKRKCSQLAVLLESKKKQKASKAV